MNDDDFVMAEYLSLNKGSHGVIGVAVFIRQFDGVNMRRVREGWSFDYGYHAGGDRFMIHRQDAEMAPQLYRVVETASQIAEIPRRWSPPPPPPAPLAPPAPQPKPTPSLLEEAEALARAKEERGFMLEVIPGITPRIAEQLRAEGVDSEAGLLALGEEGIQKFKGVGQTKARIIMEYLAKRQ